MNDSRTTAIPALPSTFVDYEDGPDGGPTYHYRFRVQAWLLNPGGMPAGSALVHDSHGFLVTIDQYMNDLEDWADSPHLVNE